MSSRSLQIERCAHRVLRVDALRLMGGCEECGEVLKGAELVEQLMKNQDRMAAELARAKGLVFEMTAEKFQV